jgi:hypothetical protein
MSFNVVFVGWNHAVRGREAASMELFQDSNQYLSGLQAEGAIDSFETVLLAAHGGDLNGFTLIRGERRQLDKMLVSEEWLKFSSRAGLVLEGSGAVRGATGDMVMQWMGVWTEILSSLS